MQEFYGLDIEKIGISFSVKHAAVCALHLPRQARVNVKLNKECAWDWSEVLLAEVIDRIGILIWQQSGAKRGRRPKPYPRPKQEKPRDTKIMSSYDLELFLSKPRKEVRADE